MTMFKPCVCYHEVVHAAEVQLSLSSFVYSSDTVCSRNTFRFFAARLHLCVEISHEHYHVTSWNFIHLLLQVVVECVNAFILRLRCWCIYLANRHGPCCRLEPCGQDSVIHRSVTHQCSLRQFGQDKSYSCSMLIHSSRIDDLVSLYPVFLCPSPMCFSQSDDIPSQHFQLFHQYSRCSCRI